MKKVNHYLKHGLRKFTRSFFPFKSQPKTYDLAVIGGGIIGISIARKAATQGLKVILIEKDEIGSGTSGHFHELLHSGARYAVKDPVAAKECFEENQLLSAPNSLIRSAITQTGGLFLALSDSDVIYSEKLMASCQKIGIPITEINVDKIKATETRINKSVKRVLHVPDGYIDGKKVLEINTTLAKECDAKFLTHHSVIGFENTKNQIESLIVRDRIGDNHMIFCGFVINAAGPWAGRVSKLAGVEIPLIPYRGALLVFEEKLSEYVLNRCRTPSDGDIFVPAGSYTIFGTTSKKTDDIDNFSVAKEEINHLLHAGEQLIPGLSQHKIINTYAGIRPLYAPSFVNDSGRALSRSFSIINHKVNGINNFISIVGGKFTIYEKMSDLALTTMNQNLERSYSKYERVYIQE